MSPAIHLLQALNLLITDSINQIWQRQANVELSTGKVDALTINDNLGAVIILRDRILKKLLKQAISGSGDINVFLFWEIQMPIDSVEDLKDIEDLKGAHMKNMILIEDNECPDHLTIAHEVGHYLSNSGFEHTADEIMAPCGGNDRARVRKQQADVVNID